MLKCAALAAVLFLPACSTAWNHPNVPLMMALRGVGSGVVVVDGWILTAKHILPVITADGKPCGEPIVHPTLDLALIPCPDIKARGLRPAIDLPRVYDRLYAYGWHQGEQLLKTAGYQGKSFGEMSAPVIHGCSGGAVINARGELVGILDHIDFADVVGGEGMYVVFHMAGYTVLDKAVRGWIGANIR